VAALLVAWAALGDLALLSLAALFPRYVFVVGPRAPWLALACLATAALLGGRGALAETAKSAGALLSRRRRDAIALTAAVVVANAVAAVTHPQGLNVQLLHPGGARTFDGVHADFDLDAHTVLRLAATPKTRVRMVGFLVPGVVPWAEDPGNTKVQLRVVARGTTAFDANPYTPIRLENGEELDCGHVRLAYLEPDGSTTVLTYEPWGSMDYPGLTVAADAFDLRFHLFVSKISRLAFLWVAAARILLAAAILFWAPVVAVLCVSRALRWRFAPARGRASWEALAVALCAAGYFGVIAPRVELSASGDQGAFLEWAASIEHHAIVQRPPDWSRSAGDGVRALAALAGHFALPDATARNPSNGPSLVNDKPIGLPLLIVVARALGGPECGYFVSAIMGSVAVAAVYAAARAAGLDVLLAALAALSLALDPMFVHSTTVLDPDAATTCWLALMLVGLLSLSRGKRYAALAGASFGMACLTRYNASLALILALPLLLGAPRRIVPFVLGGLPCLAALLWVNTVAYGGPLRFPYRDYVSNQLLLAPYGQVLLRYARAFASDASPALWVPFLAYPFLRGESWQKRGGLTLVVLGWFAFFGTFAPWDHEFVRYLLPVYPAIFVGGLLVWRDLFSGHALAKRLAVTLLTAAWLVPRALAESPEPLDAARIAVGWLDDVAPKNALVFTDVVLNNAVHYYTDRRRFPVTLPLPRGDAVDLAGFASAVRATGNGADWYLLLRKFELEDFRASYPEMGVELVRSGSKWALYRITGIEGAY
jgi:hypothetical protein